MAEVFPTNDDDFMGPAKCLRLLTKLHETRMSREWPALSTALTDVVFAATIDLKTWSRQGSITKLEAEIIISLIMRLTHVIKCKVCFHEIEFINFSPSKLVSEVTICQKFVKLCYKAFVQNKAQAYAVPFDITYNENVAKITARMTVKSTFEKRPQGKISESALWSKLEALNSSSSLLTASPMHNCVGGCGKVPDHGENFAIVDCCLHLSCIDCAKRNFDVLGYLKSRCPKCQCVVTAWTDDRNFKLFKMHPLQKNFRNMVKQIGRNIKGYGYNEYM